MEYEEDIENYEVIKPIYYKDLGEELKPILKKMCLMVKAPYTKINFSSYGWFRLHNWTRDQQNEFRDWLADYLYKAPAKVRKKLLRHNLKTKKYCLDAAKSFVLSYGWVTNDEEIKGVR